MATAPTAVDRRQYGDMADDICLLRSDGRIVARFKDGFRVDSSPEIFSAIQVRGMAVEVRARRDLAKERLVARRPKAKPAPDTPAGGRAGTVAASDPGSPSAKYLCAKCGGPRSKWSASLCRACYVPAGRAPDPAPPMADVPDKFARPIAEPRSSAADTSDSVTEPVEPTRKEGLAGERGTELCGCGRRKGHGGRCWFMRGETGPTTKRNRPHVSVCDVCGGPRSVSSTGSLCRKCHLAMVRKSSGHAAKIAALEIEVAELKGDVAAFKAMVRAAVGELVAHIGMVGR